MPSTTHTVNRVVTKHRDAMEHSTKTKSVKHLTKNSYLYPVTPSSDANWVLYEKPEPKNDVSTARRTSRNRSNIDLAYRLWSAPEEHVTKPKAATLATRIPRQNHSDSKCLKHMSSRRCSVMCIASEPLADVKRPPPAPMPPRLSSPDLSDLDEKDMFPGLDSLDNIESDDEALFGGSMDAELGKLPRHGVSYCLRAQKTDVNV